MSYRKVHEITEAEFLGALTVEPQKQAVIFVRLGGDPHDHNYARLSFLTRRLRNQGHDIRTSRVKGVWLGDGTPEGPESPMKPHTDQNGVTAA